MPFMDIFGMELFGWLLALLCVAAMAVAAWRREHFLGGRAQSAAEAALNAQEAALRLLRLSATDQRNVALTLFGHAEAMEPASPALTGLARRLLDMSEDLAQQVEDPGAPRILSPENVALMPVVQFAVSQVAAHLGPSRRTWRIDTAFHQTRLLADRRALNQVLVNVLSNAAASTRDGDWIELSAETGAHDWAIVVQDEGIGLPVAQGGSRTAESRGIGLRLTLARSLITAHGGSLSVETAAQVGTRVRLGLPRSCILEQPKPLPSRHACSAQV